MIVNQRSEVHLHHGSPGGLREASFKSEDSYVKSKKAEDNGFKPKKVLVLGSSMGYGLASRISLAFAGGAATLGVMFDRPASGNKTGTSGWYNTQAFEKYAKADGCTPGP